MSSDSKVSVDPDKLIKSLDRAKNFDDLIKMQQEIFKDIYNRLSQMENDIDQLKTHAILSGNSDLHELFHNDVHDALKDGVKEDGRSLQYVKKGGRR